MTKRWWKAGQHLLVMVVGLLMFATVAAGGQPAAWAGGTEPVDGSVTLVQGGEVVYQFSPGLTDGAQCIRIHMTVQTGKPVDAANTFISVASTTGDWKGFLYGFFGDGTFISEGAPTWQFNGTTFDFPVAWALTPYDPFLPEQGAGLQSVVRVKILNSNDCTITISAVEASPFDPAEMVEALILAVQGVNEANGIANNSLEAKLQAAVNALDDANNHNNAAAINSLEAFQSYCESQYAKGLISETDKVTLVSQAQDIIDTLTAMSQ